MATERDTSALKRQRTTIKSSCTRINTYVDSVASMTPSIAAQLEERKSRLDEYWSQYNEIQLQIEMLDDREGNDRANFEDAFYSLSAKIRELLNPPAIARGALTHSPSTSRASDQSEVRQLHVRLPKLNLPTLSGKYDEWFPFFDSFNSVIHSNPSLNDIQRLQYLKASVTGEAGNVISSLEISELNYEVAWNLLKERYDNKRVIVHAHIKSIMDLPTMAKENVVELRKITDGVIRNVQALQALKRSTSQWDDLLVYILAAKLDMLTMREWQSSLVGTDPPTFKQFIEFITRRCEMLEATSKATDANSKSTNKPSLSQSKRQASCVATVKPKCNYCNGEHPIYYCQKFLALSIPQRTSEVRKRKICINCLRSPAHAPNKCTSRGCRICKGKHNTLLHAPDGEAETNSSDSNHKETNTAISSTTLVTHASSTGDKEHIMLSTAVVDVFNKHKTPVRCRVLLDCGSQANFISRECVNNLGLQPHPLDIAISGVNQTATRATQGVRVKLHSRFNAFSATIECIVTNQVTGNLPAFTVRRDSYNLPRNLRLADPQFNVSSKIDILIGAELFWDLLCVGQVKPSTEHPTLQKTQLGWILAGRSGDQRKSVRNIQALHTCITNVQLHEQLNRFWQLEDISNVSNYTSEEASCERHFSENVARTPEGRYIVQLPVKDSLMPVPGNSRDIALKRLINLERRLRRNPEVRDQYVQFMAEYSALGHMKQVDPQLNREAAWYLPHHCVFKNSKQSSKIRVVFDASCKNDTGSSLNDMLRVGPVVQQDLMSIVMRFRTFAYVLVADIVKMYRQVLIHPAQTCMQRILWRSDPASEINTYELVTVTYGTSPASFLTTRCLKHLAEQYSSSYPIGSKHVERDFYMDDLLTGANTTQEAAAIRDESVQLLSLGAFELSRWASNCPDLLKPMNDQENNPISINDGNDSYVLGIQWNQATDTFHFAYTPDADHDVVSKRTILSEVSRLFDPLGLLGPVIVVAKLILQDLWRAGTHWDESVPQNVHTRWSKFRTQLPELNHLAIPRRVKFGVNPQDIQIHGFCDASQYAFGACVYIRTRLGANEFRSELLCSKSRVAPLKAVSLPRLELSAALLLARLIEKIRASVDLTDIQIQLWSDSTIVLRWISSPSRKWTVFVANRVGEIQRLTDPAGWRHVTSAQNPADVLSRGLSPPELINAVTWWHGPSFLAQEEDHWPNSSFQHLDDDVPEQRKVCAIVITSDASVIDELLKRHSSLDRTCRILAYCLRFSNASSRSPTLFVTHEEVSAALQRMCKIIQQLAFAEEYKALSGGRDINTSSRILSLSPFIDSHGLLRVGGRLRNSDLPFEACHPILLPRDHELTKRIIGREHVRNMHAGILATMAAVRQQYWPLSLRSVTRKIISKCIKCFRVRPILSEAIMGSLLPGRVSFARPFSQTGVDYAGPLILREGKRRNARNHKAYVAIFVCFATKAIYVELVSDLTSDAFIAALKRFISRRGKPSCMHSDNGTTFVGASNQLQELSDFLDKEQVQDDIKQFLRDQQTAWSFIPPNAPHFGGLWEAAVKSAKHHLNRIVGKAHLTFEEMSTVLCEVEAILNSRPLTPLSADANDLMYLSPGHFLVGAAMNSLPCHDLKEVNKNRLVRWQRVEQLRQHFWRRWSSEYLHHLQVRSKWKSERGTQLGVGQLVLVKQQDLPPLHWLLGRVQGVHAGADGVARSAVVRTAKGSLTRPLSKLAILPMEASNFKC